MEKNTPHCRLNLVKTLIETGAVRTTQSARLGATAMGFDFDAMLDVMTALTVADF